MEEAREQQIQELEILQTIYPDEFYIFPNTTDYGLHQDDNDYEQLDGNLLTEDEDSDYGSDEEEEEEDNEVNEIDWTEYSIENHPNPIIFEIRNLKIDFVPPMDSQYTIESIENNIVHNVNVKIKLPLNYLADMETIPFIKIYPHIEYDDEYIASKYNSDSDNEDGVIFDDDGDLVDKAGLDLAFNCHIKNSNFYNMLLGDLENKDPSDQDNYDTVSWIVEMVDNYQLAGTPMLFNIIAYIKESFESGLTKQLENFEVMHQQNLAEKLELQNAKFKGTKVTKESFNTWRTSIRSELNLDKRDIERKKELHAGRLTGKEIFDKGLANIVDEDED
ncbi:hypothetical protein QEN19_001871 [Hanseniaspora menglaensis]